MSARFKTERSLTSAEHDILSSHGAADVVGHGGLDPQAYEPVHVYHVAMTNGGFRSFAYIDGPFDSRKYSRQALVYAGKATDRQVVSLVRNLTRQAC